MSFCTVKSWFTKIFCLTFFFQNNLISNDFIQNYDHKSFHKFSSTCKQINRYNDIGFLFSTFFFCSLKHKILKFVLFIPHRYRIQQGSFDDFTIDNQSGIVTISRKLDFDRRNTYQIEIVASDSGKFCRYFYFKLNCFLLEKKKKTSSYIFISKKIFELIQWEFFYCCLLYFIFISRLWIIVYFSFNLIFFLFFLCPVLFPNKHIIGTPSLSGTATLVVNIMNSYDKAPYFTPATQRAEVSKVFECKYV